MSRPDLYLFYILVERWSVYVKDGPFFQAQGGLKEKWGEKWIPVKTTDREKAREMGHNGLYGFQVWPVQNNILEFVQDK